ncbi:MAG: type II secretion system protein GspE, partial [Deltaproteobacteria bacterium]|nr:type II secretion system protein GspE [Deltaproteobacteria bacterium]
MSSRIGDLLVRQGLLTQEQLKLAQDTQSQSGGFLSTAIIKLGVVTERQLVEALAKQYGLPIVAIDSEQIDPDAVALLPHNIAVKHNLVPLRYHGSALMVSMVDPSNILALNDVKFITGRDIHVVLATESDVKQHIEKLYESNISYDSIIEDLGDDSNVEVIDASDSLDLQALEKASEDAPVVKLVNAILTDAIKKGASDIHIE